MQANFFNFEQMSNDKEKKSFFKRLKHKYRLIIFNDHSYEEVVSVKLTKLNLISLVGSSLIFIVALVSIIIAFTQVRELIPGYPTSDVRRQIIMNALLVDSLENEIRMREQYYTSINDILSGREPRSYDRPDTTIRYEGLDFNRSEYDDLLRSQIERSGRISMDRADRSGLLEDIPPMHFIPPLRGLIINRFNSEVGHYGVDMVSEPNEPVTAVMDGTIIFANWTQETGYVIQIQHQNNFLSFYKHNAELLKEVGDVVRAGDPIAIVGDSGELTTGPHLHFELWHSGVPLNPEDYIDF